MPKGILLLMAISLTCCSLSYSKGIEISNMNVTQEPTELGGPRLVIEYDLNDRGISKDCPTYVFIRYSKNAGTTWELLPMEYLRGSGFGLVESPGHKKNIWWGTSETSFKQSSKTLTSGRRPERRKEWLLPSGRYGFWLNEKQPART